MNILIATPSPPGSKTGNRVTAERWARMMRSMGHRVEIVAELRADFRNANKPSRSSARSPDLLISLHATKTHAIVDWFERTFPDRPIAVCLTGTDLHDDLSKQGKPTKYKKATRSLETADLILSLRPVAPGDLATKFHKKLRVIEQSAEPTKNPSSPLVKTWEVSIAGHLRTVKDPFLITQALRHLPNESRIDVRHYGAALRPSFSRRAASLTQSIDRYRWLGEWPRGRVRRSIARSRLLVMTSKYEGGPSVFSEAIVDRIPIISTDIDAARYLLGDDYPGLFPVGDAESLAAMMWRAESDAGFYRGLKRHIGGLRKTFLPQAETKKLKRFLAELTA